MAEQLLILHRAPTSVPARLAVLAHTYSKATCILRSKVQNQEHLSLSSLGYSRQNRKEAGRAGLELECF